MSAWLFVAIARILRDSDMPVVFLGLGSNIEPEPNLRLALKELRRRFVSVRVSPVYRSAAVGFEGPEFLNLVMQMNTDASPASVHLELEEIHAMAGRERGCEKYLSRRLDIDLLIYGQDSINEPPVRVPRKDILEYAYVLKPLSDLAPDYRHPTTGKTFREHWQAFDQLRYPLVLCDVDLDVPRIPSSDAG
jgi:2-amino-4-hydroxy-6-hydroxymethyldihydropteridine diphosphokinase